MSIITWIIFGGLAGWIASMITGRNQSMGIVLNVIVGICGAILGGTIAGLIGISSIGEINLVSFMVAVFGAVILISIINAFDKEHHARG
jgi:uncharacterized membrane protein YeaQ/YmgE (transglycosylase-associated protein family)